MPIWVIIFKMNEIFILAPSDLKTFIHVASVIIQPKPIRFFHSEHHRLIQSSFYFKYAIFAIFEIHIIQIHLVLARVYDRQWHPIRWQCMNSHTDKI